MIYASGNMIDRLKAMADIIFEKDAFTTYLGFCTPGTILTSDPNWSVMKITTTADIPPATTQFLWANGQCNYNLIFDDCETFAYTFKKF